MTIPSEPTNGVLAEMIKGVREDVGEVKTTMHRLEDSDRVRIAENAQLSAKVDAAHRRIDILVHDFDNLKAVVDAINKTLPNLVTAYRVGIFIMSALGVSIIALIWSLIIGQAHLSLTQDFQPITTPPVVVVTATPSATPVFVIITETPHP